MKAATLRPAILLLCLFVSCSDAPGSDAPRTAAGLRRGRTIPLRTAAEAEPAARRGGRIDHLAYDPATKRLFVACIAEGSLDVVDLGEGKPVRRIRGLSSPQGVALVGKAGRVAVSCGGDGSLRLYDTRTLEERGRIDIGADPDNVRFAGGFLWVGYGSGASGAIAKVDPAKLAKVGDLRLPGHAESFQLQADAARVFVNVPFAGGAAKEGSVVVGDLENLEALATWTLPATASNFPMALDAEHGRVLVVSRRPARLTCLDAKTGKVLGKADCVAAADDLFVVPGTGRVLLIGAGRGGEHDAAVEVFEIDAHGVPSRTGTFPTCRGARTGLLVRERDALYVACPGSAERDAQVLEILLAK